ncbi:MAG: DNA primase [Bacillota bacterium]
MSVPTDPCPYGFRILGPTTGTRRLVGAGRAWHGYLACVEEAQVNREAYLSAFTYGENFRYYLIGNGTTKGYAGVCAASFIWWDIDREDDLDLAINDARRLAVAITDRLKLRDDDLLVFFSGAKGFHLGLPTCLWAPEPSTTFNRTARAFAEEIAASAQVSIDGGVYDKVRAFRAPNSRHPKTGLHKRRLSLDELLNLSVNAILMLAQAPAAIEWEPPTGISDAAADHWDTASQQIESQTRATVERFADGPPKALNRLTLEFIRHGAMQGDRHRLLFSAAANLAEFGCPPALAHALLTEAGLDSGLPPKEVRRQIESGLAAKGTNHA